MLTDSSLEHTIFGKHEKQGEYPCLALAGKQSKSKGKCIQIVQLIGVDFVRIVPIFMKVLNEFQRRENQLFHN